MTAGIRRDVINNAVQAAIVARNAAIQGLGAQASRKTLLKQQEDARVAASRRVAGMSEDGVCVGSPDRDEVVQEIRMTAEASIFSLVYDIHTACMRPRHERPQPRDWICS